MKDSSTKLTLDDIAFEGRNKGYGAYLLRKKYQVRLLSSFVFSLCFLLIILVLFSSILHRHSAEYIYNPVLDAHEVGVNLAYHPHQLVSIAHIEGTSAPSNSVPVLIVEDDLITPEQNVTEKNATGNNDSTGTTGNGQTTKGQGNPNNPGSGVEGEIYGSADINPQFPGGIKAMQQFIKDNLQYPEAARRTNISGSILIYVVVVRDGSLTDVKVLKCLQTDLDAEAIRVVKSMPLWKPALRGGKPVNVRCIIPISVSPIK